ncbi:TniQ family protein [Pseudomonas sp. TE3911]
MDASNQCRWHACTYSVDAVWPFVPPLLEDEIISSWLVRCALRHGCDPTTLTNDAWPGYRIWCSDPDRRLSADRLDTLGRLSGMPTDVLHASTLLPVYRSVADRTSFPDGAALWFLCLGARNRRRCGGLQYCPLCFAEREPFFPIQSRLAWHTCCPIHEVTLLDRCGCCHAPLCPHLVTQPRKEIGHCHRCGYRLSSAPVDQALPHAARFQEVTDGLFAERTQSYGDTQLDLRAWLELAHWMLGILRSGARSSSPCTSAFFYRLNVNLDMLRQPATGLRFELLNPSERSSLLSDVWNMVQVGPDILMDAAAQEEVRSSLLMPRASHLPAALKGLAAVLKVSHKGVGGHLHPDAPRSPSSVLMRWNRLLRKFQR